MFKPGAELAHSGRWLGCGLGDQGIDIVVHWPAGRRDFPFRQNPETGYGATPASYSTGAEAVCLGVKRPCREANLSNEVKNDWHCTSIPPYAFMASCRETALLVSSSIGFRPQSIRSAPPQHSLLFPSHSVFTPFCHDSSRCWRSLANRHSLKSY